MLLDGIDVCPPKLHTVSHSSYALLFQGPHFLTKILEFNIHYDNLFIDILSVLMTSKKILESLMRIILLRQRQFSNFDKNARAT